MKNSQHQFSSQTGSPGFRFQVSLLLVLRLNLSDPQFCLPLNGAICEDE